MEDAMLNIMVNNMINTMVDYMVDIIRDIWVNTDPRSKPCGWLLDNLLQLLPQLLDWVAMVTNGVL